jgi:ATP-dependent RNA helicase DDX24/MAK5
MTILSPSEDDERVGKRKLKQKNLGGSAKLKALKANLAELLHQPVLARGISAKFITSGSRPIVDDLLRGDSMSYWHGFGTNTKNPILAHDTLLGVKVTHAKADVLDANRRSKGKRVVKRNAVLPPPEQEA